MVIVWSVLPVCGEANEPDSTTLALTSRPAARIFTRRSAPQLRGGDARTLGHGRELGPGDLAIPDARPDTTVGAGHHVLFADQSGVLDQPVGDQPRMFDDVRGVADH